MTPEEENDTIKYIYKQLKEMRHTKGNNRALFFCTLKVFEFNNEFVVVSFIIFLTEITHCKNDRAKMQTAVMEQKIIKICSVEMNNIYLATQRQLFG